MRWQDGMWLLPLALMAGAAATAAEPPPAAAASLGQAAPGATTRLWLERQRRGTQASPQAQPLPGPVMEQVYERYRKSFAHPIPERLDAERLGAGSSGR